MRLQRQKATTVGAGVWKSAAILVAIGAAQFYANQLFDSATLRIDGVYPKAYAARSQESRTTFGDANDESTSPARRLLNESIARLEGLRSFSAELDFEAKMFGERYSGRGRYEETSEPSAAEKERRRHPLESTNFRLRVSTEKPSAKAVFSNAEENVLEVVCDVERRALWTYTSVEGAKNLTHINIEELLDALTRLGETERQALADAGFGRACGANGLPELGGLSGTLKRLGEAYRFEPNVENADWRGKGDVFKIVGTIKPEYLARLTGQLGVETLEPFLAENAPTEVEIFFGKDWPFPYKIQYFSISEDKNITRNDIFFVEYSSVVMNDATIRPENFKYNQPQINFDRATSAYLERLIPRNSASN